MAYKVTVMNSQAGMVIETVVVEIGDIAVEAGRMKTALEEACKPICPQCGGLGLEDPSADEPKKCGRCNGRGRLGSAPDPKKNYPAQDKIVDGVESGS